MTDRISPQSRQQIREKIDELRASQVGEAVEQVIEFGKTPAELKAYMDRFVIGQERGKKVTSVAIAYHYRRLGNALKHAMENGEDLDAALRNTTTPKANILIVGPTGCGKTYTSEVASRLVGVPFAVEDLTKFSEVGYVGQSVSDILLDLLIAAGGNTHVAQMGMVYLDEIDKIATESDVYNKDVSGRGVQKGLLKLVEGANNTIDLGKERISLSTRHVLFIAGGVYEGLEDVVRRRMAGDGLQGDWREYLITDDFVACGMERQLMARFPIRTVYDQLTVDDLKAILLKSEDSPSRAYVNDLKAWGIDLIFTDEALTGVARQAEQERTGARGLISILHRVLLEDMYRLPGTHMGELVVDGPYVQERVR